MFNNRENHSHKIFVNPNFNKKKEKMMMQPSQQTTTHYNPAFTQYKSTPAVHDAVKQKIYINPNYVSNNPNYVSNLPYERPDKPISCASSSSQPSTACTSRYKLIRQNDTKPQTNDVSLKNKLTVNISKYKTVKIIDIKKNMESSNVNNFSKSIKEEVKKADTTDVRNKYKLVREKSITKPNLSFNKKYSVATQKNQTRNLSIFKNTVRNKSSIKNDMNKMKKTNIPCRLFRKYGRCLRKEQGVCQFIHDKKHVSMCKKFLKGKCFDTKCYFSHEVSSKKMPTCSFYLNGMCSKENCPYLHVKLNESTEICPEFAKGYCEKGDECTKRHVVCSDTVTKRNNSKKFTHPLYKTKITRTKEKSSLKQDNVPQPESISIAKVDEPKDARYYKETITTETTCELKPTRAEIGTLPSFIKI